MANHNRRPAMNSQNTVVIGRDAHRLHRKHALYGTAIQLLISLVGFSIALKAYMIATNVKAGSFWPHLTILLGGSLAILGVCLKEQGKGWMVTSMVVNTLGIIMAVVGCIIDSVAAGHIKDTDFSRCIYSKVESNFSCNGNCIIKVSQSACFCCYLYKDSCKSFHTNLAVPPEIYMGVVSCHQVEFEYQNLLWISVALCIINFVVTIVACALVNTYKSSSAMLVSVFQRNEHPFQIHSIHVYAYMDGPELPSSSPPLYHQWCDNEPSYVEPIFQSTPDLYIPPPPEELIKPPPYMEKPPSYSELPDLETETTVIPPIDYANIPPPT